MSFTTTIAICEEKARAGGWVASGSDATHSSQAVRKGCVAAVKALTGAPETARWRRGKKVKGNNISPGTAIATFPIKENGVFKFKGHAAILHSSHTGGLIIYDQYYVPSKPFGMRTIQFTCGDYISNDGEAFYVIETIQDTSTTDPALCGPTSYY